MHEGKGKMDGLLTARKIYYSHAFTELFSLLVTSTTSSAKNNATYVNTTDGYENGESYDYISTSFDSNIYCCYESYAYNYLQ